MKNLYKAAAALVLAFPTALAAQPAAGQDRDRGGEHRDRDRGAEHRDRGGGWDRDGRNRGDHRGHDRHNDDIGGAIIGGVIGGLLGGSTYNYRFQYDDDYYSRRGYGRNQYNNWRGRDRGYGCEAVGYGRGCRTIYYDRDFVILNLGGEVYCYRREYRGWRAAYCPREWYRY